MAAMGAGRGEAARSLEGLSPMVGRTPLLELRLALDGREVRVHAKYEALNFTGSIKDRMALHILARARERGALRPGDEIVEASSGNTAISFAAFGAALGHPVRIFMPDWMSEERKRLLVSLGATLVPVSAAEGGFVGAIARAEDWAREHPATFLPRQFESPWNPAAHAEGTGREIADQLRAVGLAPSAFVAGVGTGGTVMGVGSALREAWPSVTVHPLQPAESPVLTAGRKVGHHRLQGISDEFVPAIVDLDALDHVVSVSDGDAIIMAQRLGRETGLAVGPSSGANVVGALALLRERGAGATVVTVLPDSNKKYLSTDLLGTEPARDDYLSPSVRILGWRAIPCSGPVASA